MSHIRVKNNALVPGFFNIMDKFLTEDFQGAMKAVQPAVNTIEKDDSYLLELVAPGLNKSDFNIAIEKDILTISYEKKEESTEEKDNYIRKEFSSSSFKRSFNLTEKVKADGISAKYENGILKVSIPKTEVKVVETKSIEVA